MHYGWAAIGVLAALSLTHCTADRTGLNTNRVWRCEATVLSRTDGTVGTVSSEDMDVVDRRVFVAPLADAAFVQSQWRRFLNELHTSDDALARIGRPPYCLISDSVSVTETFFTGTLPPLLTSREIDREDCHPLPPPANCGNSAGVYPTLAVTPSALAFADQPLGLPAVGMIVTYANAGSGRLCLGTPMIDRALSPNPSDFVVDASDCAAAPDDARFRATVLSAARPSCQVTVFFNPIEPGARRAGLRASSNDPDMRLSQVPLAGTGITGVLALSPTSLCFNVPATPDDAFPTWQHQQTATLLNSGPGAVRISNVTVGGEGWARRLSDVSGAPRLAPFTLTAGGSVQVTVFEEPGTAGSSTLMIDSNASNMHIEGLLQGSDSGCAP
jgi:hypothetical protein